MLWRFVREQNLSSFAERFKSEADPARRALIGRLLIEEEDKYGQRGERLDAVNEYLRRNQILITQHEALLGRLARKGTDGATLAQAELLRDNLMELGQLLQGCRDQLASELDGEEG